LTLSVYDLGRKLSQSNRNIQGTPIHWRRNRTNSFEDVAARMFPSNLQFLDKLREILTFTAL